MFMHGASNWRLVPASNSLVVQSAAVVTSANVKGCSYAKHVTLDPLFILQGCSPRVSVR